MNKNDKIDMKKLQNIRLFEWDTPKPPDLIPLKHSKDDKLTKKDWKLIFITALVSIVVGVTVGWILFGLKMN